MRELMEAMEARAVRPLVHDYTLSELRRVLAYPECRLTQIDQHRVFDRYLAVATVEPMPAAFSEHSLLLPPGFPRCRDSHDQPFLALAYHARADLLITKDKAILKLRKKARKFNVEIAQAYSLSA